MTQIEKTQIEKIKAEIERLIGQSQEGLQNFKNQGFNTYELIERVKQKTCQQILSFIDSSEAEEKPESEDERIRKTLIHIVKGACDKYGIKYRGDDITKEKLIAYLERQKDERELGFIEGKVEGVKQTYQEIKDAMSLFEPKDLTPFEFTFRDYIDSAIRYCLSGEGYQQYIKEWAADLLNLEKQKEQKPESCDCSRDEESYTNGIHHVLMNPEAYGLIKQQPAEWSEEDEGMLNCIIATLCEESHGGREANGKMVTWLENRLKSLRPQPKQEWSEEFLRLMGITISQDGNQVCVLLGENLAEGIAGFGDTLADAVEEFKKEWRQFDRFRKATWKPSDVQMEALAWYSGNSGVPPTGDKAIKSLYNDLKKL